MRTEFETTKTTRARMANQLGFARDNALDKLDRASFESDEAYIDACVEREIKATDPARMRIKRQLEREYAERQEAERQAKQDAAYKEIRVGITLDGLDHENIHNEATRLAQEDLAAGRIFTKDLGKRIAEHAEELAEKRKNEKAENKMMNAMFRGLI